MRFNLLYFLFALGILIVEILIATVFERNVFVRGSVGDFLVVILLYFSVKAFYATKPFPLALAIFVLACLVEFTQALGLVERLGMSRSDIGGIVLGTTFSWEDILAYSMGCITAALLDRYVLEHRVSKTVS